MENLTKVNATVISKKGMSARSSNDNFYLNGKFMYEYETDNVQASFEKSGQEYLFGVYDGEVGEESSEKTSISMVKELKKLHDDMRNDGGNIDTKLSQLSECVELTNNLIYSKSINSIEDVWRKNSFAGLVIYEGKAATFNTGNSSIYVMRDGAFRDMTSYNKKAERLLKLGIINNDQAKKLSRKTSAYSDEFKKEIKESNSFELAEGDTILLCNDGLKNAVDDARMETILAFNEDVPSIANRLMREAVKNGVQDSITIMLVKIENLFSRDTAAKVVESQAPVRTARDVKKPGVKNEKPHTYIAAIVASVIIAGFIFAIYVLWDNKDNVLNAFISTDTVQEASGSTDDVQNSGGEPAPGEGQDSESTAEPQGEGSSIPGEEAVDGDMGSGEGKQEPIQYIVQSGDSLQAISQKFYNDINKFEEIMKYNNLKNPDELQIGQVINIPDLEGVEESR